MKTTLSKVLLIVLFGAVSPFFFTSCTVDQEAALTRQSGSATKKKTESATPSWAERQEAAKEEREKKRIAAAKAKKAADEKKARELAAKKKAEEAELRKLALQRKKEDAEKAARKKAEEKARADALARRRAMEEAEEKARVEAIAKRKAEADRERAAKLAARRKAEQDRVARLERDRREREARGNEVAAVANRSGGGGLFSQMAISTPSKYRSKGHHIKVNQALLPGLNSSNAKIEIDLSEQRARVFKTSGTLKQLVIETQISSGKPGHSSPTGSYRIKEKLVQKRSTLYGTWHNSSGATVQSSGDSRKRPSGATRFVGAEMPYWMRITGGVGMHVGYVPNGPASHGCIRVPPAIQPLIYSKVGVGTPVTIKY
ncbi:MAG: L,D-transpeptidase family protein [Verrucomicrobiota bacterium]